MVKKLVEWLIMRKVKNAAGDLEAKGFSIAKICAVLAGILKTAEFASAQFGHGFVIPNDVYGIIASVGAIGMKEGIDRSAPAAK